MAIAGTTCPASLARIDRGPFAERPLAVLPVGAYRIVLRTLEERIERSGDTGGHPGRESDAGDPVGNPHRAVDGAAKMLRDTRRTRQRPQARAHHHEVPVRQPAGEIRRTCERAALSISARSPPAGTRLRVAIGA